MEGLMPATTTATELQRNYKRVVQRAKKIKKPLTVLSNNRPELIVIDYKAFRKNYRKVKKFPKKKSDFSEFLGVMSIDEADRINKVIEEECERIFPEDWK